MIEDLMGFYNFGVTTQEAIDAHTYLLIALGFSLSPRVEGALSIQEEGGELSEVVEE
jgi:hypothetical protein